jgi:hypothetical protein
VGSDSLTITCGFIIHFVCAAVNSSPTSPPLRKRQTDPGPTKGIAISSNFGSGAKARAVITLAGKAATPSLRVA